jgi:ATP-dependent exoDNAse (exonuclease V) beta subunit
VTDFQHLAQAALHCLEPAADGAVSPVLLAEDLRLEHLLVDEFQDTSHTQHRLIRRLTEGWQPGDGRTLFLVGDPMQSIYRFREADVGLFTRAARQRRLGTVPVERLALTANFRSRAEIVHWANEQFRGIFPPEDRRDSGAVAYHKAAPEQTPGGSVQLHPLPPEATAGDEARQIAALIRDYRADGANPEIAVLVRARSHLQAIARELSRAGIAYDAVEIDPLADRPVIQDLLALARVLSQPADRVAWLALLRAPWCALTVPVLHRVAGEDRHADLLARLTHACTGAGSDAALPAGVRERLRRLHDVLQQAFAGAGTQRLAARVETAWLQLGGPRCYAGPEELENAAACLVLLDSLERESPVELTERLQEALAHLYARGRPAPLQLMTVHKAKGLEFDIVIVPGMQRTGRRNDSRLVMAEQFTLGGELVESGQAEAGQGDADGVLMAAVTSRRHSGPSLYDYLKAVDAERQRYELQRLLYVAATRARTHLHLFGRFGCTSKGNVTIPPGSFMELLRAAFRPVIEASGYRPGAEPPATPEPARMPLLRLRELPRLRPWAPAASAALTLPQLPDRNAAALGDALHRLFELIHDFDDVNRAADWAAQLAGNPAVLDSLLRRGGAEPAALPALRAELQALLRRAITTEPGRALLSRQDKRQSCSELPVLARDGDRIGQHIIDLVYQDAGGAWHIVDYKTGQDTAATREAWRQQLSRYAELMEKITGTPPVSLRVYLARGGEILEFPSDGLEAT